MFFKAGIGGGGVGGIGVSSSGGMTTGFSSSSSLTTISFAGGLVGVLLAIIGV